MATPVQPQTAVKIPEQKLNPQATPFVEKKEQGVATKDHFENDLEKILVDIFHAINENSKENIHDVQIHTEQNLDDKYYTNCKKLDLIKEMNNPYYEISLTWWFIIITISVIGNYFHFETHNYMVI